MCKVIIENNGFQRLAYLRNVPLLLVTQNIIIIIIIIIE